MPTQMGFATVSRYLPRGDRIVRILPTVGSRYPECEEWIYYGG